MTLPASPPARPRAFVWIMLLLGMGGAWAGTADQHALIARRIHQVETGLLPEVITPRTVPASLVARMRAAGVPGLSLAVVDHGQLAWAHAWGEAAAGQPMRTDTLLQAASISKPVSAVAALQLVAQGRLGLDEDIAPCLRSWPLPPGAQSAERPVTLRRLLSHSAGFNVEGFDGYAPGEPLPTLRQVLDGQAPARSAAVRVELPPGSQWRYAGGGYTVLQQLLEDLSGQAFAPWLQTQVLAPAGMTQSFFAPAGPLPPALRAQAATGHRQGQPLAGGYRIHPELAAAGLWTTPSDLARFSIALPRLLPPPLLAQALTPQSDDSGLGFVLDPATGRHGHDGSNAGFESRWLADGRQGGRAIVVMTNANDSRGLMNEVIRAVAKAQGWADWMPPTQAALVRRMARTPLFVRGSLNDWGTSLPLRRSGPGRLAADSTAVLPAGPIEFKIASEDWRSVDLGASTPALLVPGRPSPLRLGGGNLQVTLPAPGRYRFELDLRPAEAATLRVSPLP